MKKIILFLLFGLFLLTSACSLGTCRGHKDKSCSSCAKCCEGTVCGKDADGKKCEHKNSCPHLHEKASGEKSGCQKDK